MVRGLAVASGPRSIILAHSHRREGGWGIANMYSQMWEWAAGQRPEVLITNLRPGPALFAGFLATYYEWPLHVVVYRKQLEHAQEYGELAWTVYHRADKREWAGSALDRDERINALGGKPITLSELRRGSGSHRSLDSAPRDGVSSAEADAGRCDEASNDHAGPYGSDGIDLPSDASQLQLDVGQAQQEDPVREGPSSGVASSQGARLLVPNDRSAHGWMGSHNDHDSLEETIDEGRAMGHDEDQRGD